METNPQTLNGMQSNYIDFADPESIVQVVTDNGGETLDRFTIWFFDGSYLGLSETGAGFSQWGQASYRPDFPDRIIAWGDLCLRLRAHIVSRYFYNP